MSKEEMQDRLEKIRERKMISLEEMSEKIGVSYGTLWRFRNKGKDYGCTFDTLKKVMDFIRKNENGE